jgi:predicted RNA-binding protein with TRAM domain
MSKRGDSGVAKIQGLVVFVAGAKVGDSLRIRITKLGSGFATAEIAGGVESLHPQAEAETSADNDE